MNIMQPFRFLEFSPDCNPGIRVSLIVLMRQWRTKESLKLIFIIDKIILAFNIFLSILITVVYLCYLCSLQYNFVVTELHSTSNPFLI